MAPTDTCTYPPADFFLAKLNNGMVPVNVFFLRIIVESKIPFQIRIFVSSACMHRALAGFFVVSLAGFRIRIHLIRIRIQPCKLNTDPDPGFLPKNWKSFEILKFLNFFYFCGSFLPFWIRIRIPNTDKYPPA